jgi:hypothetical protein
VGGLPPPFGAWWLCHPAPNQFGLLERFAFAPALDVSA